MIEYEFNVKIGRGDSLSVYDIDKIILLPYIPSGNDFDSLFCRSDGLGYIFLFVLYNFNLLFKGFSPRNQ